MSSWKTIAIRLNSCLDRYVRDCEYVNHAKSEYHTASEPCSVVQEQMDAQKQFDDMLRTMPDPRVHYEAGYATGMGYRFPPQWGSFDSAEEAYDDAAARFDHDVHIVVRRVEVTDVFTLNHR